MNYINFINKIYMSIDNSLLVWVIYYFRIGSIKYTFEATIA